MTQSLSKDLHRRGMTAVDGGMSRRGAAKRFGISPYTAIKWVERGIERATISRARKAVITRSHLIETRVEAVLALVEETPDMTPAEIVAYLDSEHGMRVSQCKVWRFSDRRVITSR